MSSHQIWHCGKNVAFPIYFQSKPPCGRAIGKDWSSQGFDKVLGLVWISDWNTCEVFFQHNVQHKVEGPSAVKPDSISALTERLLSHQITWSELTGG